MFICGMMDVDHQQVKSAWCELAFLQNLAGLQTQPALCFHAAGCGSLEAAAGLGAA